VPPGGVGYVEYLEGKYGPGALDTVGVHLRGAAAADGLPLLDLHELERRPSTFLAHRLLAGALEEGEDEDGEPVQQTLQQRLGLGLLSAHWARGEDVGEREVLEGLAEAAGMPAEQVVAALDDDLTATAVRLDEARAAKLGIRAVPTFQFGRRFAVSGAQTPAALADAARRAMSGA
jgi:predicted DsbA family dithiol-disulfide isomerase